MECVREGAALGLTASEISDIYGIRRGTVTQYLWSLQHPDKSKRWRDNVKVADTARRHRIRKPQEPRRFWPPDRVQRLKQLWAFGLSASEIAGRLGGLSRNAVLGKIYRLHEIGEVPSHASRC